LPDPGHFGQIWPNPGHFGQIRPEQWQDRLDPAGFRTFWPDSAGTMAESGQIWPASNHGQIPASFGQNLVSRHFIFQKSFYTETNGALLSFFLFSFFFSSVFSFLD